MISGKTVLIVLLAIVLVAVVFAVSVWRTGLVEGNKRAAAEATARYEFQIDSLQQLSDSLRTRVQIQSAGADTMFIFGMMRQIDTLRGQILRMSAIAQQVSGQDSISFYLSRLGDSSFYTYYGDYQEAKRWYIAPEWFGMLGRPGIPALIAHLDSASGFALEQTLYALRLASQHESVTSLTGRETPIDPAAESNTTDAIVAWKRWAKKWGFE